MSRKKQAELSNMWLTASITSIQNSAQLNLDYSMVRFVKTIYLNLVSFQNKGYVAKLQKDASMLRASMTSKIFGRRHISTGRAPPQFSAAVRQ